MPGLLPAADYPATGNFQRGAKTWADNCGRCHNIRGPGDLRDDQWISTVFHMRVRGGLVGQEVRDVLTFLQGSNKKSGPPAVIRISAAKGPAVQLSGKEVYNGTCVACHGVDGSGVMPGVPDFTSNDGPLNKADDTLVRHVVEGYRSPGSSMAMPPNGGDPGLTVRDVRSVIVYMKRSFVD